VVEVDLGNVRICAVALGGAGIPAGTKLMVGNLGYLGCPVFWGLGGGADGVYQNHDGVVVVAADVGGKKEEDYEDGGLVSPEATRALLHHATSTATAA
jgi:hypothetical protein